MIIWINGPYGIGKSTLAEKLGKRIDQSFLFDAELVGDAVRENFPKQFFQETYEEIPLWTEMCCKLLEELDAVYEGCVLVPMTLVRAESAESIIGRLKCAGVNIRHIILEADFETIRERILARGEEEDCWCMQQIEKCLDGQRDMRCDLRLKNAGIDAEALAEEVLVAMKSW